MGASAGNDRLGVAGLTAPLASICNKGPFFGNQFVNLSGIPFGQRALCPARAQKPERRFIIVNLAATDCGSGDLPGFVADFPVDVGAGRVAAGLRTH